MSSRQFDILVLGAGAAGLMCAIEGGRRGRRVAVLERADRAGRKILISGGGRCNFTNLHCTPDNFLSENPHFARSALARYTPADFIALIEKHRIPYHEKTLGQLFCDRSAEDVTQMLEAECQSSGVQIFLNSNIREVRRRDYFIITTSTAEFRTPVLVVATGGQSIPKMGATTFGYEVARQFGLKVIPPRPALVPLTLNARDRARYCDLSGVSAPVIATAGGKSFRESMLITHRGLSGPAILQISSYWRPGSSIEMDLAADKEAFAAVRGAKTRNALAAKTALAAMIPHRLATRWLEFHGPDSWSNQSLADLEKRIHHWILTPSGTEGFDKAEVTAGGIDTNELSSKTMESRKVPGLFFIGEVVDVTGHLGGLNFQWAWSSGAAAGRGL